jgi:hypothetical protein
MVLRVLVLGASLVGGRASATPTYRWSAVSVDLSATHVRLSVEKEILTPAGLPDLFSVSLGRSWPLNRELVWTKPIADETR